MNIATGFVIMFIALMGFLFLLMLLDAMKLRRLRKKYNEKEDKSKQGEQRRNLKERESGVKRFDKFERPEFLQTTTPSKPRKDSTSSRGFFARRRRK